MGCDLKAAEESKKRAVSIHAPTWGATRYIYSVEQPFCCFNPRTHMGCDIAREQMQFNSRVSIHAPTWGATHSQYHILQKTEVSIHAPTWGATRYGDGFLCFLVVSIHAPTWGATLERFITRLQILFQSTHPHGVRLAATSAQISYQLFQSTHPHGVRHVCKGWSTFGVCFNPRTHMGCDFSPPKSLYGYICVSIHAPTWGATVCQRWFLL